VLGVTSAEDDGGTVELTAVASVGRAAVVAIDVGVVEAWFVVGEPSGSSELVTLSQPSRVEAATAMLDKMVTCFARRASPRCPGPAKHFNAHCPYACSTRGGIRI
jgi:hypothetical protein